MIQSSITSLVGVTLSEVTHDSGSMHFISNDGRRWTASHVQDCCESVRIEEIVGDIGDLLGSPIVMAEESTNTDNPPSSADEFLWTFYKFRTAKGDVTVRWLGESNGYYGVSVDFWEGE
jgi:hypothetical protein